MINLNWISVMMCNLETISSPKKSVQRGFGNICCDRVGVGFLEHRSLFLEELLESLRELFLGTDRCTLTRGYSLSFCRWSLQGYSWIGECRWQNGGFIACTEVRWKRRAAVMACVAVYIGGVVPLLYQ